MPAEKRVRYSVIVEVEDKDTCVGLGESAPSRRYQESVASVVKFFRMINPARLSFDDVQGSAEYLNALSARAPSARAALSGALYDGAAKKHGTTLNRFLGLGFREDTHFTSISIGLDGPAKVRRKVLEAQDYPILKLKLGGLNDIQSFRMLRSAAPKKLVRVDANEAWKTKEEALKNILELASDGRVQFVEQPMPTGTPVPALMWLKKNSPLPLIADESYRTARDISIVADTFHGVNVKLCKTGGVLESLEALKAAKAAGLKTMLGCMIESSVLISTAAHLAELCDYIDLDGNLLVTNDPFEGVIVHHGVLSFTRANSQTGIQVSPRG